MILTDASALLYIEPTNAPIFNRSVSQKFAWFKKLLSEQTDAKQIGCYEGGQTFTPDTMYLGHHTCSCGAVSTGYDILLPNRTATNSLAFHYITQHTDEVPAAEWQKLADLKRYTTFKILDPPRMV